MGNLETKFEDGEEVGLARCGEYALPFGLTANAGTE